MDMLLARWAERFSRFHPAWTLEVDGKGSRVALRVLSMAGADLAAFSRNPTEAEMAESGLLGKGRPLLIVVGYDTLRFLWRRGTRPDIDALSPAYHGPVAGIRPVGRNLSSGTRAEAQAAMGGGGDFGEGVRSLSSPSQVALAVAADPLAVGYGGAGWSLSRLESSPSILRIRPLVLALPPGPLRPEVVEFLSFVLSRDGQELVARNGFRPIATDSVPIWRKRAGLDG